MRLERKDFLYIYLSFKNLFQSFRFTVLVTGPLSDRIGRKRLLQILSLILYIVSAITQLFLQFVSMSANTK